MGIVEEASAATRAVVLVQSGFLTQSDGWTPRQFHLLREKCTGDDAAVLGARSAANLLDEPTRAKLATLRSEIRCSLGLASDAAVDFIYNTAGLDDGNAMSLNVAAQRGTGEPVDDAASAAAATAATAATAVADGDAEEGIVEEDDRDTQLDQESEDLSEDEEDGGILVCAACELSECLLLMARAQRGVTGMDLVCCECSNPAVPECRSCLGLSDSESDLSDAGSGDDVCERCEAHSCLIVAEGEDPHCCVCNGGNAAACCRPCQHTRYRLHGPKF